MNVTITPCEHGQESRWKCVECRRAYKREYASARYFNRKQADRKSLASRLNLLSPRTLIAKQCPDCPCGLLATKFHRNSGSNRADTYCKRHHRERSKRWHATHSECHKQAARARKLRERYGLTQHEVEEAIRTQGGVCWICKQPFDGGRKPTVDHCHATGKVRGILCIDCNQGIGHLGDDLARLTRATDYLKHFT